MTDCLEEQANELEALESIYPDELQIVSTEPFHSFRMLITSQCEGDIENATCIIQFTYTENYPDEAPAMEILSYENIEEEESTTLLNIMMEQVEENIGMAMIFTLVSAAQEKLTELVEQAAHAIEEEKELKIRAIEEAERKRLEGTRVTVESFIAWKTAFDAECLSKKKLLVSIQKGSTKLTGKELFMTDSTLDDSDVKFLDEDGSTSVAVDESLFQDLDDLDIDTADLDFES